MPAGNSSLSALFLRLPLKQLAPLGWVSPPFLLLRKAQGSANKLYPLHAGRPGKANALLGPQPKPGSAELRFTLRFLGEAEKGGQDGKGVSGKA